MNLFDLPEAYPKAEQFDTLVKQKEMLIERIVSSSQSAGGFWYDADENELEVMLLLLCGKAILQGKVFIAGDWMTIPAGQKYRVEWSVLNDPCIWLAIHYKKLQE